MSGRNGERITTAQVFELVDKVRVELTTSINRLESKFDSLEAGRLSRLEATFAEVTAEHKLIKKIVFGLVGLTLTTVAGALLALVIMQ